MSIKIAGSIIAFILISLITIGSSYISSKVDREEFETHCVETKRKFDNMQNQIDAQLKVNHELLKTLNRMEVKIERVETNTEWLIKEVKK